jgi:ribosomal protein L16
MKYNYWVKKYKYKIFQKQLYRLRGFTSSNFFYKQNNVFLLKTLQSLFLTSAQLEAGRRVIRRFLRRYIKVVINLKCTKSITAKATGTRMGKGKGAIKEWILPINRGLIIYAILNLNIFQAKFILKKVSCKLGFNSVNVKNSLFNYFNFSKNFYY